MYQKRGRSNLILILGISLVLIFSLNLVSASLLGDINNFIKNFFGYGNNPELQGELHQLGIFSSGVPTVPVYRFYNNNISAHFYTISESEKEKIIINFSYVYIYEGPVFFAYAAQANGTYPVYRLYNKNIGSHFYTISESEKNNLLTNYPSVFIDEGTVFYVYATQANGTLPVYRFYNRNVGTHFYTISESEKDKILLNFSAVYTYEGPVFYAFASNLTIVSNCSDGTIYNSCSITQPKFCSNGSLVLNCSKCSCPSNSVCLSNGSCNINNKCSDGTIYNSCSITQPKFCINGSLLLNCSKCGCPSNSVCLSNGSCNITKKCSDGTLYNSCSTTKPKFCSNGSLLLNCSKCGCPTNNTCLSNGSCSISAVPPPKQLFYHWKFDGNAKDYVRGNNGTVNGAIPTTGVLGSAYFFNGINNSIPTILNDEMSSYLFHKGSLSAWIKCSGANCSGAIASYSTKYHNSSNYVWRVNNNKLEVAWNPSSSTSWNTINSSVRINDGMWHHVVFTADGSSRVKIYVDGVETSTSFLKTSGNGYESDWTADINQVATTWHIITLGAIGTSKPSNYFQGTIDEVKIWNYALNATDVEKEYNSSKPAVSYFANLKNMSKYSDKGVFLISDTNWKDVLQLVPLTTWAGNETCKKGTGTPGDICVYPTLIYHAEAGEICNNGKDDNGDGKTDCCDSYCTGSSYCIEICNDAKDNDCDSYIDCTDSDCKYNAACKESICNDGKDNDNDGLTDCKDSDCKYTAACKESICNDSKDNDNDSSIDCKDSDCKSSSACKETICNDNKDNDNDGSIDCKDSDCASNSSCIESNCTDGKDNDNDGSIDCTDSDCKYTAACKETICNDGKDNDNDSSIDCKDSDCVSNSACIKPEICNDSIDNEGDGMTDCFDDGCYNSIYCEISNDGKDNNKNGLIDCQDPLANWSIYCDSGKGCYTMNHKAVGAASLQESCVCNMDSYCCKNRWDGVCANEFNKYCSGECSGNYSNNFSEREGYLYTKNMISDPTFTPVYSTINGKNLIRVETIGKNYNLLSKFDIVSTSQEYMDIVATQEELNNIREMGFNFKIMPVNNFDFFKGSYLGESYHTYDSMKQELLQIQTNYPGIAKVYDIGNTIEGRDMYAMKLSDNVATEESNEPEILVVGNHHAREIMTVEIPMYEINYLVSNYNTDQNIKNMLNNWELWFVPMANPDGHVKVEGGDIYWRKNTRNNNDGSYGVDLNRNYGYTWGYDNSGSSPTPSSDSYRGTSAFSEPETQAIRTFAKTHNLKYVLDYHAYGEYILYPWGHLTTPTPDDSMFSSLASNMKMFVPSYTSGRIIDVMYNSNGDSIDWYYGEQTEKNKTLGFGLEINSAQEGGFRPPATMIEPTSKKHLQVLANLLGYTLEIQESTASTFDADSIIHFMQQYNASNVAIIGASPQDLDNLLIASKPIGLGMKANQTKRINVSDYLSYWTNYASIVFTKDDYETALTASVYASLINSPLIIKGTSSDKASAYTGKKIICIGVAVNETPNGANCSETKTIQQAILEYKNITSTDKVILVNPNDLSISATEEFFPEKSGGGIRNLYTKTSLVSPLLAAAKKEIIITNKNTDFLQVDQFIESKFSSLNLSSGYLTIIGSPDAIPVKNPSNDREVDFNLYADLNDDSKNFSELISGRIMGISTSDVSSLLARTIFYNDIKPANSGFLMMQRGDPGGNPISQGVPQGQGCGNYFCKCYFDRNCTDIFNDYTPFFDSYKVCDESTGLPQPPECDSRKNELNKYMFSNATFVMYGDHGGPASWANNLGTSELKDLPPLFAYSFACLTCDYDYAQGDLFCTNIIRRGSVGYIGAVSTMYGHHFLDEFLLESFKNNATIGKAFWVGKNKERVFNWTKYNDPNENSFYGIHDILLGDPTFNGGLLK